MSAQDDWSWPVDVKDHEMMCDEIDRLRAVERAARDYVEAYNGVATALAIGAPTAHFAVTIHLAREALMRSVAT